jgi:aspartyl-tRNA(Asn)/glutamyl-tRNA(Gln) amidotransferase subunit B
MFSASSAEFGAEPNSHVDPVVLGLPGALPAVNRMAIECALRMALATGSTIRRASRFARKHYFYPDLPKGYQISQYDEPIAEHGTVELTVQGGVRTVRLNRIHLEEDAGKNTHRAGSDTSLVDLNRAGVPLIEIVTEPDLRSAEEAAEYLRALRAIVRTLGISDGNMEEGSLRADVNVSIRPVGTTELGTRTELKNINSFKFVQKAVEYEIGRQQELLERGERVVQETRLWDAERGTSHPMRSKEHAHDYRYFPDPDLPPLTVDEAWIERVRAGLPELPMARQRRFVATLGLTDYDAAVLCADRALGDYFEAGVRAGGDPKKLANWVQTELLRELNREGKGAERSPVSPESLAELLRLIDDGTVSGKLAKEVFGKMVATGRSAKEIVAAEGLTQVTDVGAIEAAADDVLKANPREVEQYRAGKDKLLAFFVGQVMKQTRGKASPAVVHDVLVRLLGGS